MSQEPDTANPEQPPESGRVAPARLPSARGSAALATAMITLGVAVGAAIGPAPEASFAGAPSLIAQRLPALIAALTARERSQGASTPSPAPAPNPSSAATETPRRKRRRARRAAGLPTPATPTPAAASEPPAAEESPGTSPTAPANHKAAKLPSTTSVWLIELAGGTFADALAKPTAAPYISGQLLPASTYLSGWSALSASAFAGEAALAEPTAPGATPPLLHSIVQPPCPEGAGGAACAPESPGQLTAADEFLKATLAQITPTPAYREHGLVVITFTSVGVAAQAGLAPGSSSATLTSQPAAGVVLLSPFAKAGAKLSATYDPTSPRQSLEQLLR